jgi:hypothetical protein
MGFYHGSDKDPGGDEPGWRETISIIIVVFQVLAKPLGILLAVLFGLLFLLWAFTVHALFGLALLGILVVAIVARGIWEAKHPPELR